MSRLTPENERAYRGFDDLCVKTLFSEIDFLRKQNGAWSKEIERQRKQLTSCSAAAKGETKEVATKGQSSWSPAYQDVLELRRKYEKLEKELKDQGELMIAENKKWSDRVNELETDLAGQVHHPFESD